MADYDDISNRKPMLPVSASGKGLCPVCRQRRFLYTAADERVSKALGLLRENGNAVALCAYDLNRQYKVLRSVLIEEVLKKHRPSRHAFDGAPVTVEGSVVRVGYPKPRLAEPNERVGLSCFVWVDNACLSENCLDLNNGVDNELRDIPGVTRVRIYLD